MSADHLADRAFDGQRISRDGSVVTLPVVQFFVGGLAHFLVALILVSETAQTGYDGGSSAIGWFVAAIAIALPSMIAAFLIGLPIRQVPWLRSRWLANGEASVAWTIGGVLACWLVLATAPVIKATDGTDGTRTSSGLRFHDHRSTAVASDD